MAQSPSHEQTNPLVGKSGVEQTGAPTQQSDAQQRPGVSGSSGAETPGNASGGGASGALGTATESARQLGEKAPDGADLDRSTIEQK